MSLAPARGPIPVLWRPLLVVALVTAAVHWPVLSSTAVVKDDAEYLVNNPLVQDPGFDSLARFWGEVLAPSTVAGYYQPLAMTSLMFDAALGGRPDSLVPFHRTTLLLHVVNAVLVALLFHRLFGHAWVAALGGLMFALHPQTVEPITWISDRKTLLATLFSLISLCAYVAYARRAALPADPFRPRRTGWLYALVVAAYVLALLSKPTSTPLPVVMLLLDLWPLKRLNRRALLEKLPLLALAALFSWITVVSQARTAFVKSPFEGGPLAGVWILAHNVALYLSKYVLPLDLSPHYVYPRPLGPGQPYVAAGLALIAALLIAGVVLWRRAKSWPVGWLTWFVLIFPTLGVIGFSTVIAADKFAYLPSLGLLAPVVGGLAGLWLAGHPRRVPATAAAIVWLAFCTVQTRLYAAHWASTEAVFSRAAAMNPRDGETQSALTGFYWQEAQKLAAQVQSAGPNASREQLEAAQRATTEALAQLESVAKAFPDVVPARLNYGVALISLGRLDEARREIEQVLRLDPDNAGAHGNLGAICFMQKRPAEALAHMQRAVELAPRVPIGRMSLAMVLLNEGRPQEAILQLQEAVRLNPRLLDARLNLARTLALNGRREEAIAEYREILRQQPGARQAEAELRNLQR